MSKIRSRSEGSRARSKRHYLKLRSRFLPGRLRLVILAESPPASGKYLYDPSGAIAEPLFSALMKLIGFSPPDKACGLGELKRRGVFVVDATYGPVNRLSDKQRDARIEAAYPSLLLDLRSLIGRKRTPVILIKANVCRQFEDRLRDDGIRLINAGTVVYFPSMGWQDHFGQQMKRILTREGISI